MSGVVYRAMLAVRLRQLRISLQDPVRFTDTENKVPIDGTRATWTIPAGYGKRFLFEIKAIDAQGHEGPASAPLAVTLQ